MEEIVRNEYVFSGSVQGVGFRYRAKYSADACGVTGWVKNEWDGTVLMEAQGSNRALTEMLKLIDNGHYIRIEDIRCHSLPLEEHEYGFHIR